MSIEEEIFNKYKINKEKLIKYGFKIYNDKLKYSTPILNNSFNVLIEYNGSIKGKVIETSYNDEYTNYRLDTLGEFSSIIKNEFIKVLTDIRDKCADEQLFKYDQTKRINQFISTKYNTNPEFLWDRLPNYCVYRSNKKWFGVIGSISRNKIDRNTYSKEEVEFINVKVNTKQIDNLLDKNGYYTAFHMNKQNWVSIILDETLSDSEIQNLICNSYNNIKKL